MTTIRQHLIFISYRRIDSNHASLLLYEALVGNFGRESVFIDLEDISIGTEWPERIYERLKVASVLLAVIGPQWLGVADQFRRRRIDNPDDWVRREIAYAIDNGLQIIPILIDDAQIVKEGLPESIAKLAEYQAIRVRTEYWKTDMMPLIERFVEYGFQRVVSERQSSFVKDKIEILRDLDLQEGQDSLALYIEPQGKHYVQKDDETFDLTDEVHKFLAADDKKVLLLIGDAGAGKSTFCRALSKSLWETYAIDRTIPLYISLQRISNPGRELIQQYLRDKGFIDSQIQTLKNERRFVFILDGYDEIQTDVNLFNDNQLGTWKAKVIISCRSEYLGRDYYMRFAPLDRNSIGVSSHFQQMAIAPFSPEQIDRYITKYVKTHSDCGQVPGWDEAQFQNARRQLPGLESLLSNPFVLSFTLTILPQLSSRLNQRNFVSRLDLYDSYVQCWFERAQKRLQEVRGHVKTFEEKQAIVELEELGFVRYCMMFAEKLAVQMYETLSFIVEYPSYQLETKSNIIIGHLESFFAKKVQIRLLLSSCPLYRSSNQYSFLHKSLLEYFVARSVFEPTLVYDSWHKESVELTLGDRPTRNGLKTSLLKRKLIIKEQSIILFLAERARKEELFEQQLLEYLNLSESDNNFEIAATNIIAILINSGIQFNISNGGLTSLDLSRE